MEILDIPFVKNPGFMCGQACAAMMIKYYYPQFQVDFAKFDEIIRASKEKYTFPLQSAILLNYFGVAAKCYSSDGYKTTKEDPDNFKKWFGADYEYERKFLDTESFDWMVIEGQKHDLFIKQKTSFDDLLTIYKKGNLVEFVVDWNTLSKKPGPYLGHFLLISGVKDENTILVHDPDRGAHISYPKAQLQKAYSHPVIADDAVIAFGRKEIF